MIHSPLHTYWAGRTTELAALSACWDRARTGEAQLVLLTGPLGSGRTALAERFAQQVTGAAGDVLTVSCAPVAEPPLLDMVSGLIHALIGCDPGADEASIRQAVARLAGTFAEPAAMNALVSHLLGLDTGHPAVRMLDPAPLQQAAFAALGDILLSRSDSRPQLLILDNLHWADPGSRNWFIDFAMRLSMADDAQHLMILATGTSKGDADSQTIETLNGGSLAATLLALPPLAEHELLAIAASRLGQNLAQAPPPVDQLVKQLGRRARGLPAQLLEALDVLIAAKGLTGSGGAWDVRPDLAAYRAGQPLPADLEEAVARRLQTLPGKTLEARAKRETPAQEYCYAVRSAERAALVSVPAEAERLYLEAMSWAEKIRDWSDPALPARLGVQLALAQIRIRLGRIDEAFADLAKLDPALVPRSEYHHARAVAFERRDEVKEAFEEFNLALEAARGDMVARARAKAGLADMQRRMGRFQEAIVLADEAKALFETLDLPGEKARVHGVLGICHIRCEQPGDALAEVQAALSLREEIGDLEGIANCHNNLGILEVSLDKLAEAEADYEKALAIFRKLASPRGAAMVLNNLSDLFIKRGDLGRATVHLLEAQRLARQVGHSTEFVTTTGNLAELFLKRKNPKEALKLVDTCLGLALRVGQTEWLAELHDLKARALEQAGEISQARHEVRLAMDAAERAGNFSFAEKLRGRLDSGKR
ncbi:MAG: tetratricopeptide repeat protein [Candidatus Sericytochromatia bacterium]|nr:tetratricopeptide repeat protein [Candidatus Tanganyikabacteria bacterium]